MIMMMKMMVMTMLMMVMMKLDFYGIRGNLLLWIREFLTGRHQQVVLDGSTSNQVPVISGVPQGTVLGALLFVVFINDLPDNVSSNVRLFADDCLLYRRINTPEDTNILQQDLHRLEEWEAKWQMSFNLPKM